MKLFALLLLPALLLSNITLAQEEQEADDGTLNPQEMGIFNNLNAKPSIATCMSGYYLVKGGDFALGYEVNKKCADAGYTRSMIWLSYLYQNGYLGEEQPEQAVYWDMRAAEAGNETGMFNYGINLLRGYGVGVYTVAGQYWINRAANLGHAKSIALRDANYDLRLVTPDPDETKYH